MLLKSLRWLFKMKKEFSRNWIASKKPRKQRKYIANAPLHLKNRLMSVMLNKELKAKYKRNSFPIRKGDSVLVMNGQFKKKSGKISVVKINKSKVAIEGIQRTKKDGTKVNVLFHPSNLIVTELNLDDKNRLKAIERKISKQETKKVIVSKNKEENITKKKEKNAH